MIILAKLLCLNIILVYFFSSLTAARHNILIYVENTADTRTIPDKKRRWYWLQPKFFLPSTKWN
jgi:hypothetical protein